MPASSLKGLAGKKVKRDWANQFRAQGASLILPYFVVGGENIKEPIPSMPGVYHLSIDNLLKDISSVTGIFAVLLFGVTDKKDGSASESYNENGIIQKAVSAVKEKFNELIVITDVCLCGYTSHGHCGVLKEKGKRKKEKFIDKEKTRDALTKIAVSHAKAGADMVAPSAMTEGQVGAIRRGLDKGGFSGTGILAYSAKYASNFYGPFRDALNSAPQFGDRTSYQLDSNDPYEALNRIEKDIAEGADIVMVKPALAYLDIIYKAKQKFNVTIAAYNVSGEYSMIKKLSNEDKEVEKKLQREVLTSIKRAGADIIITYGAKDAAKWLS